jgi:hypothetical protein
MKAVISSFCHSASYLALVLTAIASLVWVVVIAKKDTFGIACWMAFVPWVGGGALAAGLIPSSILFVQSHDPTAVDALVVMAHPDR